MPHKSSSQIRKEFLDYFAEKEHAIVPSAPVVPEKDPTLLFTNAGMNQFKSIFLGEEQTLSFNGKEWNRAADTQKCIRVSGKHNDLEEVGHDTYHHTLFEMLGNWSFGDYFKKEAIGWAWELLVDRWGMDPGRLYATVFEGDEEDGLPCDDEAIELWKSETTIDPSHILKFGKKDNFWEMGDTGPCGPCSEIHVDLRSDEERKQQDGAELVNMDDPRVMEIWNLVFIQFNRLADGSLKPLPSRHVDTGMGFERVCAVLQGKRSNYDSDVFTPLLTAIADLAGTEYGRNEEKDIAMRVIADHIRAVTCSVADGASPGNDGRGYVIRRIQRRAVRYGWDKLGFKEPFMYKLVPVVAEQFAEVFPEITAQQEYITNVVRAEERSFLKTLGQGIEIFREMIKGKEMLDGADAFKLHDTYGFPIDLTQLMAREQGVEVDAAGFNKHMQEQKERARAAGKFTATHGESTDWITVTDTSSQDGFIGYDHTSAEVRILQYRKELDRWAFTLDRTPFYAESGGQVADTGILSSGDITVRVMDVQKVNGQHLHFTETMPDDLSGSWQATVDQPRRREIQKHHSATHLVHAAMREVLGEHVAQKGSLVSDDRLRFDFSHYEALTPGELDRIEQQVNARIQENIPLKEERDVPLEQAREMGATMLFGEKYGEHVRVITFDDNYSKELCGGTHVRSTGEIGYFRFLYESSVAAGIRRIEAVAGAKADQLLREEKQSLRQIRELLGQGSDPVNQLQDVLEQKKALEKELDELRLKQSGAKLDDLLANGEQIGDVTLIRGRIDGADMNVLKQMGYDALQKKPERTVTVLGSSDQENGKAFLMVAVTDDLIREKGLKAGALVGQLGRIVGGGGGGQPNLATAGGRDPQKLDEALEQAASLLN